ncbi:hypothetical protein BBP40_003133 [Aspergillus hancockii]|nr:hypothetical protein BBP40_003133 [Aspergillus hancockii]
MQAQLQTMENNMPANLVKNKPIFFHLIHTEISLYETALAIPTADTEGLDPQRLDHLYACLNAVKAFFDLLLTVPTALLTSIALPDLIHMSHCLVTLFRLSTLDYPGWDKATVRDTVDIIAIAGDLADRLNEVAQTVGIYGEGAHGDPYSKLATTMLKLRGEWVSRLSDLEAMDMNTASELPSFNMDEWDFDSFLNWSEFLS